MATCAVDSEKPLDSGVFVPSVDRALSILEFLGESASGHSLSELSLELGIPKNAVFRITNTLRSRGYITRDERSRKFLVTDKLFHINQPRVHKRSLVELAIAQMRDLRNECHETVQIGRRLGDEGVILEQVEALHALRICVDAGLRFPLHNNAPGKLLLAYLPTDERDATLQRLPLTRTTARTITDREALLKECALIRRRGFATDLAEADEGIHCIAAPIRDRRDEVLATVWISGPSRRLPKSAFAETARLVIDASDRISDSIRHYQ